MKILRTLFMMLILLKCSSTYSQQEITLTEGMGYDLCGKTVIFDGIWIDGGQQKADISVLDKPNSKPITGGYIMYDEIEIGKCKYYIQDIYKEGINPKGGVTLTKKKPPHMESIMFGRVVVKNGDKIYSNDPLSAIKIEKDSGGTPVVLTAYEEEDLKKEITLTKGSIIWFAGYPFELANISMETMTAEFLVMNSYLYK